METTIPNTVPGWAQPSSREIRAQLVRPSHPALAQRWTDAEAGFEFDSQDERLVLIVIGAQAGDEQLPKLARRFGFDVQQLLDFRARPVDEVLSHVDKLEAAASPRPARA